MRVTRVAAVFLVSLVLVRVPAALSQSRLSSLPVLAKVTKPGGVYPGVGAEQNLTYSAGNRRLFPGTHKAVRQGMQTP